MKQIFFAQAKSQNKKKVTCRERFLASNDRLDRPPPVLGTIISALVVGHGQTQG